MITSLLAILLIAGSMQAQYGTKYTGSSGLSHNLGPDLVVTGIKLPYVPPEARVYTNNLIQLRAEVTIKNQGNAVARNGFGIRTTLSHGYKTKVHKTFARLQPGQSTTLKMTIHVSSAYNGRNITLLAKVDSRGLIRELSKQNNTRKVRLKLPLYRKLIRHNL